MGLLSLSDAALAQGWQTPPRFARPALATEEGNLWAYMDREETRLRRSRFLIRDADLNEYVSRIACRLAGEHCPDMRVYLVRTPLFNANMAPNGMMQVWSGLLLRMANEAQLAAVLGHEIGHFLARHSLERLQDAKARSAFGQFLGLALGVSGAGSWNSLAQMLLAAGQFAYTRDHERQADEIGMALMVRAGYAPLEAARVWEQLLAEIKAEADWTGEPASRSVLFASHPPEEERQKSLAQKAAELGLPGSTGEGEYRRRLAPHRRLFLEDEVKRRRPGETLALLERSLARTPDDGELLYFRGEVYRIRAAEGDEHRALASYLQAEQAQGAPAEVHRAMGMVHRQLGQADPAKRAFRRYLDARPGAEDAELIHSYLKERS
jgi:predicted Zn-dependent protease